jgi:hypothetical protein
MIKKCLKVSTVVFLSELEPLVDLKGIETFASDLSAFKKLEFVKFLGRDLANFRIGSTCLKSFHIFLMFPLFRKFCLPETIPSSKAITIESTEKYRVKDIDLRNLENIKGLESVSLLGMMNYRLPDKISGNISYIKLSEASIENSVLIDVELIHIQLFTSDRELVGSLEKLQFSKKVKKVTFHIEGYCLLDCRMLLDAAFKRRVTEIDITANSGFIKKIQGVRKTGYKKVVDTRVAFSRK